MASTTLSTPVSAAELLRRVPVRVSWRCRHGRINPSTPSVPHFAQWCTTTRACTRARSPTHRLIVQRFIPVVKLHLSQLLACSCLRLSRAPLPLQPRLRRCASAWAADAAAPDSQVFVSALPAQLAAAMPELLDQGRCAARPTAAQTAECC